IAALRWLAESSPREALDALAQATRSPSDYRRQQAWQLIGTIPLPAAADLLASGLVDLAKKNGVAPHAMELIEAAGKRSEPVVKSALAAFVSAQNSSQDPLAKWLTALEGGDPSRGAELFESHPAGQCMRCHASGHGGGDAGPDLSDIALRADRRYLLEALVNPAAEVAIGYGIASVTLNGGRSVSGIVVDDQPAHVDIDSAGEVYRIARGDIRMMTPPVSSMPPMAMILQPAEIRDLVAWLAGQKAQPAKKSAHRKPVKLAP
ncbi:MAG TPA: hypothetical protein VLO11_06730, partial [Luteolibacter sp.]|nr:hypothetical protein [Luteolibacter sp.]